MVDEGVDQQGSNPLSKGHIRHATLLALGVGSKGVKASAPADGIEDGEWDVTDVADSRHHNDQAVEGSGRLGNHDDCQSHCASNDC